MRFRTKAILHVAALVLLTLFTAGLDDPSPWLVLVLFVLGAFSLGLFSLPGARRYAFRTPGAGTGYVAKKFMDNGFDNMGHEDRRTWDRNGRSSRRFCLALIGITGSMFLMLGGFGTAPIVIVCLAAALGVEFGFLLFTTGDYRPRRYNRTAG